MTPVKDSHTRIQNKTVGFGQRHGRCMDVTPERTFISVGEWPLHINVIINV